MLSATFLVAVSLFNVAFGGSSPKRFIVHTTLEQRSTIPSGWAKRSDAGLVDFDREFFKLPIRINLAQNNLHRAEELIMGVSSPDSRTYGQHYTPNEVMELFAPRQESINAVMDWLADAGFDASRAKYSKAKGSVLVEMSVAEAEKLLHAEYSIYEHVSGHPQIACESYSVPNAVRPHIDFVTPTLHFDVPLGRRSDDLSSLESRKQHSVMEGVAKKVGRPNGSPVDPKTNGVFQKVFTGLTQCDTQITPVCLEALYQFQPYTQLASKKNSYGIVEYTPQSYTPADLDVFAKNFSQRAVGYRPQLASIDGGALVGGTPNFNINGESNLDLQYAIALSYPVNITLYQVGDVVQGGSFNNFLDGIDASYCTYQGGIDSTQDGVYPDAADGGYKGPEDCGKYKPTNVISTSYGYNEADLTPAYEARQCYEYMKLGLQGVTVLYSSGDFGVAGNSGQCINPTTGAYANKGDPAGVTFNPAFPSTCPYVTAVGATQVNPGATVTDPESACEQVIYSGGGFSNNFLMPAYQKYAVQSYFASHKPSYTSKQYNNSGIVRGYPDISANGANYLVALGGKYSRVYGTSASAPVVGSIVTLINDARLAVGKKSVGFINPVLYSNPGSLNDITNGTNQGCLTQGFSAVKGWDPVTGLGTPNFPKLLATFLALP